MQFVLKSIQNLPFLKQQILVSSKQKEFADENLKLEENGRKFSEWIENTVFKRLVQQTREVHSK